MKRLVTILILSLACGLCAAEPTEKARELDKLLGHLGYDDSLPRMLSSLTRTYQKAYGQMNLPAEVWEEVGREMRYEEIRAICAKLYDEELTLEEIKAANAFYESEVGRSYAKKVSAVGEKELYAAREWAKQKFEAVVRRHQQQSGKEK